ncbi:MAG: hypothetical protein WCK47_04645 [bacterium]
MKHYLSTITATIGFGLAVAPALADRMLFDMEGPNPVTNTWIVGNAEGVINTATSTDQKHTGNQSLRWRYILPATPGGNWPVIEMAIPGDKSVWTGGTGLVVWMYFDLTAPKTFWTIQPYLAHPYPTIDGLGNWNAGTEGMPNNTWTQHTWDFGALDVSNVSHLRFDYAAGDGWEALAKSGNVDIYLDDIAIAGLPEPPTTTTWVIFDMEAGNPVTGTRIAGAGAGTIQTSITTAQKHSGTQSLLWRYILPSPVGGNWPIIEMAIPSEKRNWTGGTGLSTWLYFDLSGVKTYWTIQPYLSAPTRIALGNWNAGPSGVAPGGWVNHVWTFDGFPLDLSNVTQLDFDYHSGDGWVDVAKDGNVDIYLDDIGVQGISSSVSGWLLY